MSNRPARKRLRGQSGQALSEYVVLTGLVVTIAVMVLNVIGGSMREAFRTAALRLLAVVTGTPH